MSLRAVPELIAFRQQPPPVDPKQQPCRAAIRFEAVLADLRAQLVDAIAAAPKYRRELPFNQFALHFANALNRFRKHAPPGHANDLGAVSHVCVWDVACRVLDDFDALHSRHVLPRLAGPQDEAATPIRSAYGLDYDEEEAEQPPPDVTTLPTREVRVESYG